MATVAIAPVVKGRLVYATALRQEALSGALTSTLFTLYPNLYTPHATRYTSHHTP